MKISPVSYSNYQNAINIRKNNNLQNNPQIPENQVAFKGLGKITTTKITREAVTKGSNKIVTALTALGVAAMASLGIKTKKEKMIQKEFDTLLENKESLEIKKTDPEYYEKLLNSYSNNPQLFRELIDAKLCYEHLDCNHDRVDKVIPMYYGQDIVTICEIDQIDPSLTPLAKKALGGRYSRYFITGSEVKEWGEAVKKNILKDPETVKSAMNKLEKTKVFNNYSVSEDYYTVEALLKELCYFIGT